jgi:hypothetical protein
MEDILGMDGRNTDGIAMVTNIMVTNITINNIDDRGFILWVLVPLKKLREQKKFKNRKKENQKIEKRIVWGKNSPKLSGVSGIRKFDPYDPFTIGKKLIPSGMQTVRRRKNTNVSSYF